MLTMQAIAAPNVKTPDTLNAGNAKKIEELRGLVASLEAAVAFTTAVAGAMPTLTQLLASSSVADVQVLCGLGLDMGFGVILCRFLTCCRLSTLSATKTQLMAAV